MCINGQVGRKTNRHTYIQTDRQAIKKQYTVLEGKQADRQTDGQTTRQADRQTGRRLDRQTHAPLVTVLSVVRAKAKVLRILEAKQFTHELKYPGVCIQLRCPHIRPRR